MKKYFFAIVSILFFTLFWMACDKVEEPLKIVSQQEIPTDLTDPVFSVDSIIVSEKQVLVEEFTGHKCVNCPGASKDVHEISEANNHRVIIYGVHAGFQAQPDDNGDFTTNFINPVSQELFGYFNDPFNPAATINRTEYEGDLVLVYITGSWQEAIPIELAKENKIDMKVVAKYFPNQGKVLIDVTNTIVKPLTGTYKLTVMIAEDGIVAPQKNNDESIGPVPDWLEYEHRNVLRDAVNGTFGTYFSTEGIVTEGESYTNQFFYELDAEWAVENCNIIAFVYSEDSGEVVQVAELTIKVEE